MSLPSYKQLPLFALDKVCKHCGILQPLSAFNRDRRTPDGHGPWCRACHAAYREANRVRLREQARAYHAANREKHNAQAKEYRKANHERLCAKDRAYHAAHRGERAAKANAWRIANIARLREKEKADWAARTPEQCEAERERQRAWAAAHRENVQISRRKTYVKHRDKRAERAKARYRENKDHIQCIKRSSLLRRRGAEGLYTDQDIADLYAAQQGRCRYCSIDLCGRYHIDHTIPLSRGGSNWPSNLALACKTCNLRKSAKTADEFAAYLLRCKQRGL